MIEIRVMLTIALVHWFADFVMQTDQMAQNKSTSNYWLSRHILTYMGWSFLVWPLLLTFSLAQLLPWILINGSLHFVTDYFTSRCTKYLYEKKDIHNFFVVIGMDQFIHLACMLLTFKWLVLK